MIETPFTSLYRQESYQECYHYFCSLFTKLPEGDSKTAVSCRKYGLETCLKPVFIRISFGNEDPDVNPLIPYNYDYNNEEVEKELLDFGISTPKKILKLMHDKFAEVAVRKAPKIDNFGTVKIIKKHYFFLVIYEPSKQALKHLTSKNSIFRINSEHLDKLKRIYNDDPKLFMVRVYCLLSRYETIDSTGYQGAIPYFQQLIDDYSIDTECFASPLNCTLNKYYSAYPDTDKYFGSLGSFFKDFYPSTGYFEANPPFIIDVIDRMIEQFELVLDATDEPLLFAIFLPYWNDSDFYSKLMNSEWLVHQQILPKKQHKYIDGSQHRSNRKAWSANVDSWYVILSNDSKQKYKNLITH